MKQTGCNTLGYGKTMVKVKEGHARGLNAIEIAKAYGLTYAAVRGGAYRLGITLPLVNGRAAYGQVKRIACEEAGSGLSIRQIADKHGLKLSSVKSVNTELKLGISRPYKKRK
jgi:hypothetical protein